MMPRKIFIFPTHTSQLIPMKKTWIWFWSLIMLTIPLPEGSEPRPQFCVLNCNLQCLIFQHIPLAHFDMQWRNVSLSPSGNLLMMIETHSRKRLLLVISVHLTAPRIIFCIREILNNLKTLIVKTHFRISLYYIWDFGKPKGFTLSLFWQIVFFYFYSNF